MPTYTIPNFNLSANIWRAGGGPPGPPDVATIGQLYIYSRIAVDINPADLTTYEPAVALRVPRGTDIRKTDIIEVAAGTGFLYTCRWVERVHLGFPNEYLEGLLQQGATIPPPPAAGLLLEDATPILLEDATPILLE